MVVWLILFLQFAEMQEQTNRKPKSIPDNSTLKFGAAMTDHMLEIHWRSDRGWGRPTIDNYHPLMLDPAAKCLHYAIEVGLNLSRHVWKKDAAA